VRALFLDRDGVICENRSDHVKAWDEFHFIPGVLAGLAQLAGTDFAVVVVTNQAIINRGEMTPGALDDIHTRMLGTVRRTGGRIDRVLVCPHRPDEHCDCRKPQPGMLLRAAAEMNIDLTQSYLIGDALTDMQAGLSAGCKCLMVLTGRGIEQAMAAPQELSIHFQRAYDLKHAIDTVLRMESMKAGRIVTAPLNRRIPTRPLSLPALATPLS
jgi:D-glycero-D-manno-heptose 1,7-bisphosphate phosphatase